jgi:hypothetical protein
MAGKPSEVQGDDRDGRGEEDEAGEGTGDGEAGGEE